MNIAHPSAEKPTCSGPGRKPQLDVRGKQGAVRPSSIYAEDKTRSTARGDVSGNQRTHTALSPAAHLQQSVGNQAVLRGLDSGLNPAALNHLPLLHPIIGNQVVVRQTKLKVNSPRDHYEQEADRVAEQVMRMPAATASATPPATPVASGVQRKCACSDSGGKCDKCQEEEQMLQRSASSAAAPQQAPPIAHEVLRSPGQSLDAATRAFMEPRFGRDFSQVRIHTDGRAADSASALKARAYTVGKDIVFAAGEHAPETADGRRLLAHELSHVLQQSGANPAVFANSETSAAHNTPSGGRLLPPNLTPTGTAVQRQPHAGPGPVDPELEPVFRAAARAKEATGVRAMISSSEVIYRLLDIYLPGYANVIGAVGYADGGKGVTARKSGKKGVNIDVTVTRDFILRLDQSNVGMMVIELRDALRSTGVAPSPPDSTKKRGLVQSIKLSQEAAPALAAHKAQQQRVIDLFAAAKAVPREQSTSFAVLQNSIDWVEKKKFKLCILTPTHDSEKRKDKMVAYFDDRVMHPQIGGTYDPSGDNDEGVMYRPQGTLGEAPHVPLSARRSMQFSTVPLFLPRDPVRMEDLSGSLVHETQHLADRIEASATVQNIAAVERLYQAEFNAYWVQRPLEEQECLPGGHCFDKSVLERPLDVPGVVKPVYGQHFGSETEKKVTNLTLEGSKVEEQSACKGLSPRCDLAKKKQTTDFKNQKQQKIFEHLIANYRQDLFDCAYVCNDGFKKMVDKLGEAVGVNLVNSIRIDALLDVVDGCDPKMLPTDPRMDSVMTAVALLDDVDKTFLRSSLKSFPAELKEEAVRQAAEEARKKKLDLSSLSGGASQDEDEKHEAAVSFWLYLSRRLPAAGLKRVQQAIQSSPTPGKKP